MSEPKRRVSRMATGLWDVPNVIPDMPLTGMRDRSDGPTGARFMCEADWTSSSWVPLRLLPHCLHFALGAHLCCDIVRIGGCDCQDGQGHGDNAQARPT